MGSMRVARRACGWTAVLVLVGWPCPAPGQLRPLSPVDWHSVDARHGSAYLGMSAFTGQPASLIGQEGRLIQLGMLGASYRSGRVMLSLDGSVLRLFVPSERFAEPSPVVEGVVEDRRTDSGDYVINTHVLFTSDQSDTDALIRFGVRLPTTNAGIGLERDQTDFFATAAARHAFERFYLDGEFGFGIHGVAGPLHNQTDPVLFGLGAGYGWDRVETSVRMGGQYDTRANGPPRGNEHLAELTWGLRSTGATWAVLEVARGVARFSPSWGATIRVGRAF